jgi:dolichol-phosphate mannosyltransferase
MKSKISLIIPTKDEPYIGTLVEQLRKIFKNKIEIIVIEKGKELPKVKAKVVRQKTDGLGNAFLEALKYAHGEIIANMDGDGSHRVEDLKKMIAKIKNADLVIGSRFIRGGETSDIQHRQFISLVARKFSAFIMGLKINDMTSGFFVVKRQVLEKIKVKKVLGYKMIFPIAYQAKKNGFKIKEVPIVFVGRKSGVSHVSVLKMSGIKEVYNEVKMAVLLRLGLY